MIDRPSTMAVGEFVYVGKSRVRRYRKEKRRKRKEEKLARVSPVGGRSPCTGRIHYTALTSHLDDNDDVSLAGYDVTLDIDADSCSLGSSGSEDLLPLLDLDLALDLRPQTDKYIPRVKMPFELFKKKDKKKAAAEKKKEESKTKTEDVKKETNKDTKTEVPEKAEVKNDITAAKADQKVAAQVAAADGGDTPVEVPDTEPQQTETVDAALNDETDKHDATEETQLLQKTAKPTQEALKEVQGEKEEERKEKKEPEKQKVEKEDPVKTEISEKTEAVNTNGTVATLQNEPLKPEKVNMDDEDDSKMGVICCNIL